MRWQHDWMSALLRDTEVPVSSLRGRADIRRFDIYRASYEANLASALRDTYPVVHRLVGEDYFHHAARIYLRKHSSTSADIHSFGADFPAFLAVLDSARSLPYLPDVARMEWLAHQAFHAAQAEPLTSDGLAGLPPEAYAGLCLLPSAGLMQSEFPVHRIWQVNQESWAGDVSLSMDEGGVRLAVYREGLEIVLRPLGPVAFTLAGRLLETGSLGAASETMDEADRLGSALHELVSVGLMSKPSGAWKRAERTLS